MVGELCFDSKAEAAEWVKLQALERRGVINCLVRQVRYKLVVHGEPVGVYVADFVWSDRGGKQVVADKKGYRTREYVIKRKLMKALYDIDILEL
jgi:hypothetical protein